MIHLRKKMEADLRLRNLRPSTQGHYVRCARALAKYHMRSPAELDEEDVRAFLFHLQDENGLKPSTVRVYVMALKFLYNVTMGRPEVMANFRGPKIPRRVPEILSGTEVETLFEAITALKYRAILMTIYGGGLRISEVCRLHITDIDSDRMVIHIREGKGGDSRYAMLSSRLLKVLRTYFKWARPAGPYLFPGRRSDLPITRDSVRGVLNKAVKDCGFTKRVTPHTLRHSFATHLLDMGTDVRVIQVQLGHRCIASTELYTQVSTQQIGRTRSPLDVLGTSRARVLG